MRISPFTLCELPFCKTHCPPPIINTRLIHLPMSTCQSQSVRLSCLSVCQSVIQSVSQSVRAVASEGKQLNKSVQRRMPHRSAHQQVSFLQQGSHIGGRFDLAVCCPGLIYHLNAVHMMSTRCLWVQGCPTEVPSFVSRSFAWGDSSCLRAQTAILPILHTLS